MFKIYALKDCGFCRKAIEELGIRGMHFLYCPMDGPPDGSSVTVTLEMVKEKYDWPTVPIIIKITDNSEKLIGGYANLVEYLENEESTM